MTSIIMVSACLAGLPTRYDGATKESPEVAALLEGRVWIPFCPEQLGGLPTPRPAADLVGGDGFDVLAGRARVITGTGVDVTARFVAGARLVLEIARRQQVERILVKARSPSCALAPLIGVTSALLVDYGFTLEEY